VLQTLDELLQMAGYTTKTYSSAKTFLDEHDGSIPGCILLDLAMPKFDGLRVQNALIHRGIGRPIIFLSGEATISQSVQAMKAGAMEFLTKPVNEQQLLSAVESAKEREKARRDVEAQRDVVVKRMAQLTAREKEVLDYLVKGWLNKQIGAALGIGEKTVKVYRGRMLEKMGVRRVPDLVRMVALATEENGASSGSAGQLTNQKIRKKVVARKSL
jgi:FixJ family two-component response regulator